MSSSEESGGEKERDLQIYHLQESVQSKAVKSRLKLHSWPTPDPEGGLGSLHSPPGCKPL